jgi:hypothetical protein
MKHTLFLLLILLADFCFADTTNSTLYIYSYIGPILAAVFSLVTLAGIKGIIPPIFSSTLWYASSMWVTRIRYVGDYTVSMSTYYIDTGNWEVGYVFLAFAGIMAFFTVISILDFLYSVKEVRV